ncbi:MAG: FMN-binding protein [Spirochaetales bacterium]|nr:FMN-binding protein [Spirochaetales bacterium]
MRFNKALIVIVIALIALVALGKILPAAVESAFPGIRRSTAAFNLATVADGTYEGTAFILPVSVRVRTTVSGGRVSSIELLRHFNGQGTPAEAIIHRIIDGQSLGVDVIAGATYSSLAILKAVENALSRGADVQDN